MENDIKNNISIDKVPFTTIYYYGGIYKHHDEYYNFSLYVNDETIVITWEEEPKNKQEIEQEIINKFITDNNNFITASEYFEQQAISDSNSVIDKTKHTFTKFELIKFAEAYYNNTKD